MRLALVAIVKNEESCIQRMLNSVATITDEQIVVDTGSSDATPELAAAAGARVFRYKWNDSFSDARNFALSLTKCPWRLFLDADEWLEDGADVLQDVKNYPPVFVGQVEIRSTFSDPSIQNEKLGSIDRVSRLLPTGVIYRGDIHEQPSHSLPVTVLPVTLGHDGYETTQLAKKGARNLSILERVLLVQHDDPYLRFQYARELKRHGRLEEASESIQKVIQSLSSGCSALWQEDAVCLALEIFADIKAFSDGLSLIENKADALENSVDFWFSVGIFSCRLAESMPTVATQALERMESSFEYCVELGKLGYKSRIVLGRESYLAERGMNALRVKLTGLKSRRF
jgi:glycosyltransferase involved in cell wall biosynthesis